MHILFDLSCFQVANICDHTVLFLNLNIYLCIAYFSRILLFLQLVHIVRYGFISGCTQIFFIGDCTIFIGLDIFQLLSYLNFCMVFHIRYFYVRIRIFFSKDLRYCFLSKLYLWCIHLLNAGTRIFSSSSFHVMFSTNMVIYWYGVNLLISAFLL